jgi:protein disulfide-isomerase
MDLLLQRLLYYDQTQSGQVIKLTSTSIFSVVDGALAGTLTAKHSENRIERMARVCSTCCLAYHITLMIPAVSP